MIRLIVAIDEKRGLADDHGIPWQGAIPTDSQYFRDQTREGTILVGFRTYEEFQKPLHDRPNFVLMRAGPPLRPGFKIAGDLHAFLDDHAAAPVWIIGGAGLYAETVGLADQLYVTRLGADFHCTKFFPEFEVDSHLASQSDPITENGISFRFQIWDRKTTR